VLADGQTAPDALLSMCERAQLPMFATRESPAFVIDVLRAYLSKHFADRTTMHGVFMDILGLGVMITGESGLGKSELGLELISRGNGLVADDAVDLYRINQTTVEGRCPGTAAEPAGGPRHWLAGHSRHFWRDRSAAQDAPEAHRAPGAPRDHGARV
jgi:serine kinase of HPr protein (carbohydrate metabolism regulator)